MEYCNNIVLMLKTQLCLIIFLFEQTKTVLISVSDPDPFGSVSFWSAKDQPKSWKISTKINKNH